MAPTSADRGDFAQRTGTNSNALSGGSGQPFTVEYYYKVKWGHAEEFLTLFKRNHYPVLKKQVELGRMLEVSLVEPRYHATEDARWDYRVTIVFKDAAAACEPFDEGILKRQLFPDQTTFQKEEQRRFEILDGHWDLPIKPLALADAEGPART
jgi:hypothetical protein